MKKSLIAAALLGALAFQAQAEVTIYGVADASITYQYLKTPGRFHEHRFHGFGHGPRIPRRHPRDGEALGPHAG